MTMTDTVEKAIEGLDDNLDKVDTSDDSKKPDTKEIPEDPDKEKSPKDDGYIADDLVEVEEPSKPAAPAKDVKEVDTGGLTPEAKYIVDNLPFMTARLKDGEGVKEVQVKSWTQLPDDLEFATKRDELAFTNALTAQENRARDLQQKFQATQRDSDAKEFERLESEAIREDIARLQKTGDLPKFKAKVDDPGFAKDPATVEVQKVLDYMNERNQHYLKEYEQGRPYRHIGFEEAYHMYDRKPAAQKVEDDERREIANKVGSNKGLTSRELKKPTVRSGTRIDQILERIDREW